MPSALPYKSIKTSREFDDLLNALYMKAKRTPEEIVVPSLQVISVRGTQPPSSKEYENAIAVLYGIGYGLKMGLKFEKLRRPKGYFDYRVGALGTFWESTSGTLNINDPRTLHWQAYLIVPAFITGRLMDEARAQAKAKHPEVPYEKAALETISEGPAVQVLHVGPYSQEQPTIERMHHFIHDHALAVSGRHHEIYISDPRRTPPSKLKTVIRLGVQRRNA